MALGILYDFQTLFGTSGDSKFDFFVCCFICISLLIMLARVFIDVIKK